MAFVTDPVIWVGVAVRTASGKTITYEIDDHHDTTVSIERTITMPDATLGQRNRTPDSEQVDIHITGYARPWRNYPDRDQCDAIEPERRAITA